MLAIDVDYICFLALFISNKNTALNSIGRLNFNTSDIMLMAAYINFYYFRKWRRLKYLRFFFRNHFYFWYRSWHFLMHCPNTIYLITNELFFAIRIVYLFQTFVVNHSTKRVNKFLLDSGDFKIIPSPLLAY